MIPPLDDRSLDDMSPTQEPLMDRATQKQCPREPKRCHFHFSGPRRQNMELKRTILKFQTYRDLSCFDLDCHFFSLLLLFIMKFLYYVCPPFYFITSYKFWFYRFIAGEEFCFRVNPASSLTHNLFR